MSKTISIIFILSSMAMIASCGDPESGNSPNGDGALSIKVLAAGGFNPNIEHGRIERYRVQITGDGIDEPIAAEFSGDADEGVIEGIPCGNGRLVSVEALNSNGISIRAGEASGVKIGGGIRDVEVELQPVPIFANLKDGAAVENTRLIMRIFADPAHPIAVDGMKDDAQFSVIDASTDLPEIYSDESTWLGSISPSIMPVGEYRFTVTDLDNGRSSALRIRMTDGEHSTPAPFIAASSNGHASSSALTAAGLEVISEVVR